MSNRLFSIIAILLIGLSFSSEAQTVVFEDKQVEPDTIRSNWGPNARHHMVGTFGFRWPVQPSNDGAQIRYFVSAEVNIGLRYRRQWAPWFATGLELNYAADVYRLKQATGKVVPDTVLNNKEHLSFQSFQAAAFMRFNLGKRGDRTGTFLDFGIFGDLYFISKHKTKNKNNLGEREINVTRRLDYAPTASYSAVARLGFGYFAFVTTFRMSDLLGDPDYNFPELPRWKFGIEWSY